MLYTLGSILTKLACALLSASIRTQIKESKGMQAHFLDK